MFYAHTISTVRTAEQRPINTWVYLSMKKKHPDFIFTFKRAGCVVVTKVRLN